MTIDDFKNAVRSKLEELSCDMQTASLSAGLCKGYVFELLNGNRNDIQLDTMFRISQALGMTISIAGREACSAQDILDAMYNALDGMPFYKFFVGDEALVGNVYRWFSGRAMPKLNGVNVVLDRIGLCMTVE